MQELNIRERFETALHEHLSQYHHASLASQLYKHKLEDVTVSDDMLKQIFNSIMQCPLQDILPLSLPFLFRTSYSPKQVMSEKYYSILHLLPLSYRIQFLSHNVQLIHTIPDIIFDNLKHFSMKTLEEVAYNITTVSSTYFKFIDRFTDAPSCSFCEVFDYLTQSQASPDSYQVPDKNYSTILSINRLTTEELKQLSDDVVKEVPYLAMTATMDGTDREIMKKGMGVISRMTNKTLRNMIDDLTIPSIVITSRYLALLRNYLEPMYKEIPIFSNGNYIPYDIPNDIQRFSDELLQSDFWDYCEVNSVESTLRIIISLLSQLHYTVKKTNTLDHAVKDYISPLQSMDN